MRGHLTPEEMIDVAECLRAETDMPHLASCDRCRRQVGDLKSALSAAARADVPEPSPLFWDHFSARVAEAVAGRQEPRSFALLRRWTWARVTSALAAAAVVLVGIAVMMRPG